MKPIFLEPGSIKSTLKNISSLSNNLITLENEPPNNVVVGDLLYSNSGLNYGDYREILNIEGLNIEIESFDNNINPQDTFLVFSSKQRPSISVNSLNLTVKGTSPSNKIFLSNDYNLDLNYLYSNLTENFIVTLGKDLLSLKIDGITKNITLPLGTFSSQDICDIINGEFSGEVCFSENGFLKIMGNSIEILEASANEILGLHPSIIYISYEIFCNDLIIFSSSDNFLNLEIDGINKGIVLSSSITYSKEDVVNLVNSSFEKKVCQISSQGILFFAEKSIINYIKNNSLSLNYIFKNILPTNSSTWEKYLTIYDREIVLYAYELSTSFAKYEPAQLALNYSINPPILTNNFTMDEFGLVNLDEKSVTLQGTYDKSGKSVLVNGSPAVGQSGFWFYDYSLQDGINTATIKVEDTFGSFSSEIIVNINYDDLSFSGSLATTNSAVSSSGAWQSQTITMPPRWASPLVTTSKFLNNLIAPLELANSLLDLIKNFLIEYPNILKEALQTLLDQITEIIKNFSNGGVYILTVPDVGQDIYDACLGGFNGFITKVEQSIEDPLDPQRPMLSSSAKVGGFVLVFDAAQGIDSFMKSLSSLQNFLDTTYKLDNLGDPSNLAVTSQNNRNIISFESSNVDKTLYTPSYTVYRSDIQGGKPVFKQVKDNTSGKFIEIPKLDSKNNPVTEYEEIGMIGGPYSSFTYIDGVKKLEDALIEGSVSSSGVALSNGKTYFYKIKTKLGDLESYTQEISGTPILPELEKIEEDLGFELYSNETSTITLPKNETGYIFNLQGIIYDPNTGIETFDVNKVKVVADGSVIKADSIISFSKVVIPFKKMPKDSLTIEYWTTKKGQTSDISLVGRKGPLNNNLYIFKEQSNILGIKIKSGTYSSQQTIVFTKNPGVKGKPLTPSHVVKQINQQVEGIRAYYNSSKKIVLEPTFSEDLFGPALLEISEANSTLGFLKGDTVSNITRGAPPNWSSLKVKDIFPEVNTILTFVESVFKTLTKGIDTSSNDLINFIDLIQKRIQALDDTIKQVQDLLDNLSNMFPGNLGCYFLEVPFSQGGTPYFIDYMSGASNSPKSAEDGLTAGIVFLAADPLSHKSLSFILKSS